MAPSFSQRADSCALFPLFSAHARYNASSLARAFVKLVYEHPGGAEVTFQRTVDTQGAEHLLCCRPSPSRFFVLFQRDSSAHLFRCLRPRRRICTLPWPFPFDAMKVRTTPGELSTPQNPRPARRQVRLPRRRLPRHHGGLQAPPRRPRHAEHQALSRLPGTAPAAGRSAFCCDAPLRSAEEPPAPRAASACAWSDSSPRLLALFLPPPARPLLLKSLPQTACSVL